jgi:DNA-binding NtrC family response regulator
VTSVTQTLDSAGLSGGAAAAEPVPGLLLVFSAHEPLCAPLPLVRGGVDLGRGEVGGVRIEDACMSRRHARVELDRGRWRVRDLGSRNGTLADGRPVAGEAEVLRLVRLGDSLFVPCADLRPFQTGRVEADERRVLGPTLRRAWDAVERAARFGDVVHVTGESGSGKELAARRFHEAGPRPGGPFVAVNCASIPEGVAERLLFGARKGAFSGAHADAEGLVQAADGGTLFLDEVGELDPAVQAKLLRVLEAREVIALGASRPTRVDLRICSATHRSLRALVGEKRFREDLYFRIGRPQVELPPLRERPEEIPYLVDREVRRLAPDLGVHASLVEQCLLRAWPGNVRELVAEVRDAARAALVDGAAVVDAARLAPDAGRPLGEEEPAGAAAAALPAREAIEAALRDAGGRVATAARALGVHRTQLRRWLAKHDVDPRTFGGDE